MNIKKHLLIITAAIVFTFIVYWKIPVKGYVPFPGDLLVGRFFPFNTMSWEGYPAGVPYKEFINADVVRQLYPWRDIVINQLKDGEIPWWNPYSFAGSPLLANVQSAPFYPLNILYFLMNHTNAWILGVILQPILAITFMFMFMRNIGSSKLAATISSFAFAFSGYAVTWFELNTIGHAILWLPLILWSIDQTQKKFHIKYSVIATIGLTSSLLAGHLQSSVYVFLISLTYALFRFKSDLKNKHYKKITSFVLALILSLIIALPELLPTTKFVSQTPRGTQIDESIFSHFILPPKHLVTFLVHDFFGNPGTSNFWGEDYGEFMGYFGVVALIFALFALLNPKKKETSFFGVLAAVALLFALPTPFTKLLSVSKIPILSTSAPSRSLFIVQFAGAVLAGFGVDYWQNKKSKINIISLILLGIVFTALWIIAGNSFVNSEGAIKANWRVALRNLVIPSGIFISITLIIISFKTKYIFNKLKWLSVIAPIGFIFLSLFEYSYFANKYQTFSEKRFVFPESEIYSYLSDQSKVEPFRFFGDYTASVTSNSSIPYKIYSVEGYDSLYLQRYGELLAASVNGLIPDNIPRSDANLVKNSDDVRRRRLQDLMGVKFILDKNDNSISDWEPEPHRFPPERYQLIWQKGKFKVYENKQSLPRAFLVGKVKVENNPQKIVDTLFDPEYSLRETVIIEEKIDDLIKPSANGKVEFVEYEPNKILLEVETKTPQLLFLSDAHYPDWKAIVDGKETKIYRANYAFRAIYIPTGTHKIKFQYQFQLFSKSK